MGRLSLRVDWENGPEWEILVYVYFGSTVSNRPSWPKNLTHLEGNCYTGYSFALSTKGDTFSDFLFALLHASSLLKRGRFYKERICHQLKRVYYISKEFAPIESKFFPYRVDPFQNGIKHFWHSRLLWKYNNSNSWTTKALISLNITLIRQRECTEWSVVS